MTVRVLVADDQDLVRTGLSMILDAQPDIEVVGQAADGHAAVELARRLRPDVCLVDIRMPGLDGIEVTELLAGRGVPDPIAVVVITTFDLDEYVHGALRAGARGFLLKDAGPELLVQAVHAAAAGDALIAPNITRRLLSTLAAREPSKRRTQPIEPLTDRQDPRREPADQDRRPQPGRDRDVGLRHRPGGGLTPLSKDSQDSGTQQRR